MPRAEPTEPSSPAIRRLVRHIGRARRHALLALAAVVVANAMALLGPLVARWIVDRAPQPGTQLLLPITLFVAIGLLRAAAGYLRRYESNALGIKVQYDLRNEIFAAIHRLDARRRAELQGGEVLSRCTTDLAMIQGLLYFVPVVVGNVLLVSGALVVMFVLSPPLTCVMLLIGPALILILLRTRHTIVPATRDAQRQSATLVGIAEENVLGASVVRSFGQESRELGRFEVNARLLFRLRMRVARLASRTTAAMLIVPALGQIAILGLGGLLAMNGRLSLGTFLAFSAYLGEFVAPLRTIGGGVTMVQQARAALQRLFEIIDAEPEVREKPDGLSLGPARGLVELDDVTFGYTPGRPVIHGLSLRVEPGETLALIGAPGSGKTTIAMLMARLYDPDQGSVRIDGHDVRDLTLSSIRENLGLGTEHPFLFRASVRDNIAFGSPEAPWEHVERAADDAHVEEFARELPDGYDTVIGERGVTLSGGQRQRVALARTLLRDPRILVLDDAVNATDPVTEERILARLRRRASGRTVVLVARRPSTLRLADRIAVIDDGRIADVGTSEELSRRCPLYRSLLAGWDVEHHDPPPSPESPAAEAEPAGEGPPVEGPRVGVAVATAPDPDPSGWRVLAPVRGMFAFAAALITADLAAGLALPMLVRSGVDQGIARGATDVLMVVTGIALATAVANSVLNCLGARAVARAGENLLYALRLKIFAHLHRLGMDYFGRERSGRILTRLTTDIDSISSFAQTGAVNMFSSGLLFVGVLVALLVLNPLLATVALGALPVLLLTGTLFRRHSVPAYARMRELAGTVNADIQEHLDGVQVTQTLGQEERVTRKFRQANHTHAAARLRAFWIIAVYFGLVEAVAQLSTAAALGVGALQVADGRLTAGALIAFYLYLGLFFSPVQQLSQSFETQQQAAVAWRQIATLLRTPAGTPAGLSTTPVTRLRGEIEVRDLRFRYPGGDQDALGALDVLLPAGRTVVVVGPTGAGKSTLFRLLARFYEPTHGRILVDGVDLREYDPGDYRRRLGVVPQEPFLFRGSIRDNIAYGRPDAREEEVEAAVRAVGAGLLLRHPGGLARPVGERGTALSAGERQLVALARAQLVDPDILLLDEATASLDPATEAAYLRATRLLSRARTSLVIAHRLTTAERADTILVLERGRIVESGPHETLLAAGGVYARMWEAARGRTPEGAPP
uniref:Putative ABC transporter n=1 Tax=Sphaerisporangium sp. SANK 60911 TaxID=1354075 RepID=V5YS92_9ACTN|nr:putative ABC transporter [Sphaerisporangium sp. SANK 60911]